MNDSIIDLEKNLLNHLDKVNIPNYRYELFVQYLNFKYHKTLEPHIDKKVEEYWRYIGLSLLANPNIWEYKETRLELSEKSIEMINKLNDRKDILNTVILLTHDKYIRNFNVLSSKNIKIENIIYLIKTIPK